MAIKNMNEHYEIWKLLPKKINLCDGEAVDAVIQNGYMLQYVNEQTEDICLAAVNQNGCSLQYVNEQTEDICLAAVNQNGCSLQYVNEQTEDICLAAVNQDGYLLRYVNEQTEDICLAAVNQDSYSLRYVNEQTEDICLAAVNQDSYSLRYVNEQIFSQGNSIDRATVIEYLEWFRVNVDIGPSEGDAIDQMNAKFQKETGKNLPEGWNYDSSGEINDKI